MNNSAIKVSIIMPLLNSIEYFRECIDSVVNQTLKEIEIICVDAGSTDGTLELLQEYALKDERIIIINSPLKSYGYQINLGLKCASGEYFGIVESDDYIKENMYEALYDIAKRNSCEVVKSDFLIFVHEKGIRKFTYRPLININKLYNKVINPLDDLRLFKAYVLNQTGIYNLNFIRKFDIKLNETPGASYQDNGLWFQIFSLSKSVYLCNEAFYMLRRDNPNSSVKSRGKVYCMCDEYDYIRHFLSTKPEIENILAPICAYFRYGNYIFTLNRIADEFKLEFCLRFSNDFRKIREDGELDKKLFDKNKWNSLMLILENPEKFYYLNYYKFNKKNITLDAIVEQNIALNYKIELLENKIDSFINMNKSIRKQSNVIVFKKAWNYYKKNGLKKTIKRIKVKLKK